MRFNTSALNSDPQAEVSRFVNQSKVVRKIPVNITMRINNTVTGKINSVGE
jgi:hypothetical protein